MKSAGLPKYAKVYATLRQALEGGQYRAGDKLPSEAELVRQYGASRITVGRAMRDLQEAGLVERRAGSGTYARAREASSSGMSFGLLIPDLGETEIFEPICQGMTRGALAREHALVWGSANADGPKERWAWELCQQYIARRIDGVFFAPLELLPGKDADNDRIARALDDAGIPVILLDRTVLPYPLRGHHDLVGVDNRRSGFVVTEHLLRQGRRRLAFVGLPHAASTVEAREAGWREALFVHGMPVDASSAHRLDPTDAKEVRELLLDARVDAVVCANDRTAAHLMRTLLTAGVRVPDDIALVGMDDVDYAELLPVPLTTLRQPTRQLGEVAMAAMLERVLHRTLPTRDILLQCQLVIRQSCGAGIVGHRNVDARPDVGHG
jgi:GntR family transcriptional regulator, arabinose operon transcriptional repressor